MSKQRMPDLAFDGTPGDSALLINGVRLKVQGEEDTESEYDFLRYVFVNLCALRDELQAYQNWETDTLAYIAGFPHSPKRGKK